MARGTTLLELREQLRGEVGSSVLPAANVQAQQHQDLLLRRTQRRLWNEFDWSFKQISEDVPLTADQRYHNLPTNIDFERINGVWFKWGEQWRELDFGIEPSDFNIYREGLSSDPPRKWDMKNDVSSPLPSTSQFELWPVPATNGTLRFKGVARLPGLSSDTDRAALDDDLIVLHAAAEMLQRARSPDADTKAGEARRHFNRLKKLDLSQKKKTFIMGGGGRPHRQARPGIDFVK